MIYSDLLSNAILLILIHNKLLLYLHMQAAAHRAAAQAAADVTRMRAAYKSQPTCLDLQQNTCCVCAHVQAAADRAAAQAAAADVTRMRAAFQQDKDRMDGVLSFARQQVRFRSVSLSFSVFIIMTNATSNADTNTHYNNRRSSLTQMFVCILFTAGNSRS